MTGSENRIPSYDELRSAGVPLGTAWHVFGPRDQLGTLNFLTPQRVLDALAIPRRGATFNLDYPINDFDPPPYGARDVPRHVIFSGNAFHFDDYLDGLYLQASSQIDALRHIGNPDLGFYGGVERESLGDSPELGVQSASQRGIVGRGVLLDVERHLEHVGRPIVQSTNYMITADDLEQTSAAQAVEVRPGDILLIRTGWAGHYREVLTRDEREAVRADLHVPGLVQSHQTAAWLWDHQVSLVASDNTALEAFPPTPDSPFREPDTMVPHTHNDGMLHRILIPLLGMALGELWALDELAADCARDGVYDFLLVSKPLNLIGGVGSPPNALAIK
jgi:kynurenine formamidase